MPTCLVPWASPILRVLPLFMRSRQATAIKVPKVCNYSQKRRLLTLQTLPGYYVERRMSSRHVLFHDGPEMFSITLTAPTQSRETGRRAGQTSDRGQSLRTMAIVPRPSDERNHTARPE